MDYHNEDCFGLSCDVILQQKELEETSTSPARRQHADKIRKLMD